MKMDGGLHFGNDTSWAKLMDPSMDYFSDSRNSGRSGAKYGEFYYNVDPDKKTRSANPEEKEMTSTSEILRLPA